VGVRILSLRLNLLFKRVKVKEETKYTILKLSMALEREETIQLLATLKACKSPEIQSSRPIIMLTILLLTIINSFLMKIKLALLLILQPDLISILIINLFSKIMKLMIKVFKSMFLYLFIFFL
jgi:hypothetical protein